MRFNIRATHPYGFRSGEWAEIREVVWENNRPCFSVRFVDGAMDTWPIYDPADPYEFRLFGAAGQRLSGQPNEDRSPEAVS